MIELRSMSGVTLDTDERYTVRLLSADGGAVLGTLVTRTLVVLMSASPSGVIQLYFAGSRHATTVFFTISTTTTTTTTITTITTTAAGLV